MALPIAELRDRFLALQREIVSSLEAFDGEPFHTDAWSRPAGDRLQGDGLTRLIENGRFFERGGCNFSHVRGASLPPSATAHRQELAGRPFEALGVSLVLHPRNPYCPTVHLNVRFFVAHSNDTQPDVWWFGGGMDLTPYYPFVEDIVHFHRTCRDAVHAGGGDDTCYREWKTWCDRYFFLKHRNEPRGVGGLFFDDLGADGNTPFDAAQRLTFAVGDHFLPAYLPIVARRRPRPPAFVVDGLVTVERGHRGRVGPPVGGHLDDMPEDHLVRGSPRRRVERHRTRDGIVVGTGHHLHPLMQRQRTGAGTRAQP